MMIEQGCLTRACIWHAECCDQLKIITPEWQMDQHYNQAASHCAQAIRLRGRT